jgi:hypothetical protein
MPGDALVLDAGADLPYPRCIAALLRATFSYIFHGGSAVHGERFFRSRIAKDGHDILL